MRGKRNPALTNIIPVCFEFYLFGTCSVPFETITTTNDMAGTTTRR